MLKRFLEAEADTKEMADEILHFINSYEIRKGEFECNMHVIEKLDLNNFIIYCELTDQNENKSITNAFSIYRSELQNAIITKAKEIGYEINKAFLTMSQ